MKNSKLKFLTSYLLEEKFLFFTGSIFTIFRVFLDVYLPTVISSIIDADLMHMENFYSFVVQKALLYLGLNILILVFLFIVRISFNKLSCNIAYKIQSSLIRHMQNFKMQYFDSSYAGDLVSRFTTDTNTIKELYQTLLNDILMPLQHAGFLQMGCVPILRAFHPLLQSHLSRLFFGYTIASNIKRASSLEELR